MSENALERYERLAERFYRETRMMAPGKDDMRGAHTDEARREAWDAWLGRGDHVVMGETRAGAASFCLSKAREHLKAGEVRTAAVWLDMVAAEASAAARHLRDTSTPTDEEPR